jgi:hypothetical protein
MNFKKFLRPDCCTLGSGCFGTGDGRAAGVAGFGETAGAVEDAAGFGSFFFSLDKTYPFSFTR